uniref:Uncharacterized protein n=1 Tax=Oryza nivara TaxID=4536 RepID=A0A0E0FSB7_ORYNI
MGPKSRPDLAESESPPRRYTYPRDSTAHVLRCSPVPCRVTRCDKLSNNARVLTITEADRHGWDRSRLSLGGGGGGGGGGAPSPNPKSPFGVGPSTCPAGRGTCRRANGYGEHSR